MSFTVTEQNSDQQHSIKRGGPYKQQYCDADLQVCLTKYIMTNDTVDKIINDYFEKEKKKVPRTTMFDNMRAEFEFEDRIITLRQLKEHFAKLGPQEKEHLFYSHQSKVSKAIEVLLKTKAATKKQQLEQLHSDNRTLTPDQERYLLHLCKILQASGHGLEKDELLCCISKIANFDGNPSDNDHVSQSVADNFLKRHESEVKLRGSSGIDPQRAAQANDEVREAEYVKLDCFVQLLYSLGLIPWKRYVDVPGSNLYNMDEVGSDTTKRRGEVVSDATDDNRKYTVTPEGDKMSFHVTGCLTSRGDGKYAEPGQKILDGAPPPVIIHSKGKGKKDSKKSSKKKAKQQRNDVRKVSDRFVEGLAPMFPGAQDQADAFHKNNVYGFEVYATPNGSMTQDAMLPYAEHFVRNKMAGPHANEPAILLLDGHSSRWDLSALYYLIENGVFPFFLPSHTSIWSQPNDTGPNYRLHKCIAKFQKMYRRRRSTKTWKVSDWNLVFRLAWGEYLAQERHDFYKMNHNRTTAAYEKTGIYPFNPNSPTWSNAIATLGIFAEEKRSEPRVRGYEPVPRDTCEGQILTSAEQECLLTGTPVLPDIAGVTSNKSNKVIMAAMHHANVILARWRAHCKHKDTVQKSTSSVAANSDHMDETNVSLATSNTAQDTVRKGPSSVAVNSDPIDNTVISLATSTDNSQDTIRKSPGSVATNSHPMDETNISLASTDTAQDTVRKSPNSVAVDSDPMEESVVSLATSANTAQVTVRKSPSSVAVDSNPKDETNVSLASTDTARDKVRKGPNSVAVDSDPTEESVVWLATSTDNSQDTIRKSTSSVATDSDPMDETKDSLATTDTARDKVRKSPSSVAVDSDPMEESVVSLAASTDAAQDTVQMNTSSVATDSDPMDETNVSLATTDTAQDTVRKSPSSVAVDSDPMEESVVSLAASTDAAQDTVQKSTSSVATDSDRMDETNVSLATTDTAQDTVRKSPSSVAVDSHPMDNTVVSLATNNTAQGKARKSPDSVATDSNHMATTLPKKTPSEFAKTVQEKLSLKIVKFVPCDANLLPKAKVLTDNEKRQRRTDFLLEQTSAGAVIEITSFATVENGIRQSKKGKAIKLTPDEWSIFLPDGHGKTIQKTAQQAELRDPTLFEVIGTLLTSDQTEADRRSQREAEKRKRKRDQKRREEQAKAEAKRLRSEMVRQEYENIVRIIRSNRPYSFDEFLQKDCSTISANT